MGWWIEHFDDLLNPLSFLIETELKDEWRHCFFPLSEVTKVVKQQKPQRLMKYLQMC